MPTAYLRQAWQDGQTSPPLRGPSLLGGDAERNFDHPSYPPLS